MFIITNYETFRENIKTQLLKLLNDNNLFAKNLEIGIYNYSLKEATNRKVVKKWDNPYFVQLYMDRMKSIFLNLQQNPDLLLQLEKGEIKPHTIAFMTHQELQPLKWKKMIEAKIKRDKCKFETNMEASTDTFTCSKCRSKKCMYYQQQTRSADEPMTTFVTCIDCGKCWKC